MKRGHILIVIALMCLPAACQATDEMAYAEALGEARRLLARDEFDAVIKKLTPWVKQFPDRAELHHGIGLAYYHHKDFDPAVHHLSAAMRLETEETPAWKQTVQFLGMAYYIKHGWQDAIPLLEKAAGWDSTDVDLAYALATCYLNAHDRENVRRAYAKIFQIEPDSPQAFLLTAHVMYQSAYGQDAEVLLLEGTKRWPDWSEFNYQLGAVAMIKGDYDAVIRYLEKDLARNPSNFLGWHYLGEAFLRLSMVDKAVEALQRAIWLNERYAKSYVLLAETHLLKQHPLLAEDALELAIQFDPQNYEATFLLARVYQRTNRPELARKQMAVAEKLRPK